jgi:hypothetical protein
MMMRARPATRFPAASARRLDVSSSLGKWHGRLICLEYRDRPQIIDNDLLTVRAHESASSLALVHGVIAWSHESIRCSEGYYSFTPWTSVSEDADGADGTGYSG